MATAEQQPLDPSTRFEESRNIPKPLKKILAWDVEVTKQFVSFLLNFVAIKSLKTHCRFLEVRSGDLIYFDLTDSSSVHSPFQISCHGVVWFVGWFAFCWIFDRPSLYEVEVNILLGLIIDVIIVACLKAATRRRRPVATDDPFCVGPDKFSFPSGHASRAFFVATFFTVLSPVHFIFWAPLVAWASATALSRLLMYRHHIVDVLCGCLVGVLEALLLGLLWIEKDTAVSIMTWISDDRDVESGF